VLAGDQAVPTHLSAFIDCHSRYVVEARYYLRENLDILLDLLIQKHEPSLRDRHAGIDYQAVLAAAGRRWPFAEFVKQLAAHLGRKGGMAAFTANSLGQGQHACEDQHSVDRIRHLNESRTHKGSIRHGADSTWDG